MDEIPEYDSEKLRSREEMIEAIDGLLAILLEEAEFLEDIQARLESGEELESVFSDFIQESRLDDIDEYLNSL